MVLRFFFLGLAFLFMFCADFERDSPNDPDGKNYRGGVLPSSSSVKSSSSKVVSSSSVAVTSSSSSTASSSSVKRSSTAQGSSSSVAPSSSSVAKSSSSVPSSSSSIPLSSSSAPPSSSSVVQSSSSVPSSSSSIPLSSSSTPPSSSSIVQSSSSVCTANDNTYTDYCSNGTMKQYGSVTYEGQTYKTVEIGSQIWMAENLNYNASGSTCYNNDPANCVTYGRLYTETMARTVCPIGWHLPSKAEWDILIAFVGGETAGKYLKATSGWNNYNSVSGNGTDAYGFAALPGGSCQQGCGEVFNRGYWWESGGVLGAEGIVMFFNHGGVSSSHEYTSYRYSVRCLQD